MREPKGRVVVMVNVVKMVRLENLGNRVILEVKAFLVLLVREEKVVQTETLEQTGKTVKWEN